MDGRRHERRVHFRGRSHPDRVMTIRIRTTASRTWVTTVTRNIGVGGAYIEGPAETPAVGTPITIELTLPTSDQTFTLPGVVRWTAADGGAGIQFVNVDVDVLLELNDYFSSLTP
ncbi:MAG: PilZ domain-containing protein [Kofleriaceae bacterium]